MKKTAFILALVMLLCGIAPAAVSADNPSLNSAPRVIPAIREWNPSTGKFVPKKGMRIVLTSGTRISDELKKIISGYFSDIVGIEISFVTEDVQSGDIILTLSAETPAETDDARISALGNEGYIIDVNETANIFAFTSKGLLYGIITILQSYIADGFMPCGEVYDYPSYPIRSGMIDVARAYVPLEYVEEITKYFAWFKLNEIHLHINDTGSDGIGYFRLESDVPGLTSDEHYTKAEYREYQKRMLEYGVEVVTEIDTPAHSACFSKAVPQYMFDGHHIDITNPDAVGFICDRWDEYITGDDPVFVSKTVHFGTDEFPDGYNEQMRAFTDTLIKHLRSRGCTPRFWGSFGGKGFNGETPVSGDAQTNFWAVELSDYKTLFKMGYDVINTCGPVLYCVPGGNYAGCCHDHTALCADIESITETNHILQRQFLRVLEYIMLAATSSRCRDRIWQDFKLIHEHCQTAFTAVAGIYIQGNEAAFFTHRNTDVCRGCFFPPCLDLCCIGRCFFIPVLDARVLAFGSTHRTLSAGAVSVLLYPVKREHWNPRCCIS